MSTTEPLRIETAQPPENGDRPSDAAIEKNLPAEEPAVLATAAVGADHAKIATIDELLPEQDDKLDEFARLELELAELNKPTSITPQPDNGNKLNDADAQATSNASGKSAEQVENFKSSLQNESELCSIEKELLLNADVTDDTGHNGRLGEDSSTLLETLHDVAADEFDHEDLIAVLKGESTGESRNKPNDVVGEPLKTGDELPGTSKAAVEQLTPAEEFEGVTIEGEGEYQIMEVVDDFEDELEANVIATTQPLSAAAAATTTTTQSPPSQKLTREEERAVAMEQIAGLKRPPRRRKQDIKPLPFETSELVSTLGADWSDDGDDAESARSSTSKSTSAAGMKTQNANVKKDNAGGDSEKAQTVQSNTAADGSVDAKTTTAAKAGARKRRRSTSANVTSVIVLSQSQQEPTNERTTVESPNTAATGFKRTRTIKRRIIWDPDAPETAISYADLVRSKSKDRQSSASPSVAQKSRSVTPKEKQLATTEAAAATEKKSANKRAPTPSTKSITVIKDNTNDNEMKSQSKQSRRSQTVSPIANGGSAGGAGAAAGHTEPRKKKISEIDRLMSDEGAASMLSSLESGRGKLGDDSDDDKPHRPLMRSRTGPTEKVNKRESTPAAGSTATTPPAKKARLPKAKPSASWDYVYQKKQQLSDDSMIIRRRSNSSYSSNASQHRLSIDGPSTVAPTKSKAKSNKAANLEDGTTAVTDNDAAEPTTKSNQKSPTKTAAKESYNNSPPSSPAKSAGNKRVSPIAADNSRSFEFLKPKETKKNQAKTPPNRRTDSTLNTDMKKATPKRGRPPMTNKQQKEPPQSIVTGDVSASIASGIVLSPINADAGAVANIVVRKIGKMAQVIFSTHASKINGTFTPELMNQIVDALDTLAHDANCNVVVLLTNGADFCRGLDLTNLAHGPIEQRKTAAIALATAAKNLLKTFATFPKPLVAGISGSVVGLGVTLLPLFDVVISSDKATLETPYAKIGQIPEGFCIWQNLWNIRTTAKTKLFWLAEKLISTDAASAGLVTKLTTTDKVNDDAIAAAKKMSNMSMDSYRYMKKATIQTRLDIVISAIDDEFEEIVKQWTTAECCAKIKKYIESGGHLLMSPKQN